MSEPRVCGSCGNTQGPFDKVWVGERHSGRFIFTCRVPKDIKPEERAAIARACITRHDENWERGER